MRKARLGILGSLIGVSVLVCGDVVLRARSAYLEGEKYQRWMEHPEERAQFLAQEFDRKKVVLDERLRKGLLKKQDYDREIELLQFGKRLAMEESPLKYAYIWYRTSAELCTPPESKWSRLARHKLLTLPQ